MADFIWYIDYLLHGAEEHDQKLWQSPFCDIEVVQQAWVFFYNTSTWLAARKFAVIEPIAWTLMYSCKTRVLSNILHKTVVEKFHSVTALFATSRSAMTRCTCISTQARQTRSRAFAVVADARVIAYIILFQGWQTQVWLEKYPQRYHLRSSQWQTTIHNNFVCCAGIHDNLQIETKFGLSRPKDVKPAKAQSFDQYFSDFYTRTLPPFQSTIPTVR